MSLHLVTLLKIRDLSTEEVKNLPKPYTDDELKEIDRKARSGSAPPISAEAFQIDFSRPFSHWFNREAAAVFVDSFQVREAHSKRRWPNGFLQSSYLLEALKAKFPYLKRRWMDAQLLASVEGQQQAAAQPPSTGHDHMRTNEGTSLPAPSKEQVSLAEIEEKRKQKRRVERRQKRQKAVRN